MVGFETSSSSSSSGHGGGGPAGPRAARRAPRPALFYSAALVLALLAALAPPAAATYEVAAFGGPKSNHDGEGPRHGDWDFGTLVGEFVTWKERVMAAAATFSQGPPKQGPPVPAYGDLLAGSRYGVCWRGEDIDFLRGGREFGLEQLKGRVGVFEITSARRRDINSGPLECHLCYVQTGAFQHTASRLRGRADDLVFISVLQHSHDWGQAFTDDCELWVRDDPESTLPMAAAQSSYMVVNENDLNNVIATLFHSVSTIPHYVVMDCRPCSGGPRAEELEGKEGCFMRAIIPDVWNPSIFFSYIRDSETGEERSIDDWLSELPPSRCG